MNDRATTDSKMTPKAAPASGHGCCGGEVNADPASKIDKTVDPTALGHAKAAETCCCGGAEKK